MNDSKEYKKSFFKKLYYSIFKLEKYGELSAEGVGRALGYLFKLSIVVAIIISIGTIIKINNLKQKGIDFLNDQIGEFSYSNGVIKLEKDEPFRAPSTTFSEVIVDTKAISEEQINQYLNSFEAKKGILVLRDKILVKGLLGDGAITYTYDKTLKDLNITELNKQQAIDYLNGPEMWKIYGVAFAIIVLFLTGFILVPIVLNAIILSIFGYLVTFIARVRMRYAAVFNLAVYSLTLSILLNTIYIVIKMLSGFTMKYFQVMYIGVAVIYLIAAIFLLKSEFIKIQQEVSRIVKISKQEGNQEDNQEDGEEEGQEDNQENNPEEKQEDNKENQGTESE